MATQLAPATGEPVEGKPPGPPCRYVLSLGSTCLTARFLGDHFRRAFATPFDWIFSSVPMVDACVQDGCAGLLDATKYTNSQTPGVKMPTAGRAGHLVYSTLVGRDVIFNHHDPSTPAGHAYFARAARRLLLLCKGAGKCADRKLLVLLNVEKRGPLVDDELRALFATLCKSGMSNFDMVAVRIVLPPPPGTAKKKQQQQQQPHDGDGGDARAVVASQGITSQQAEGCAASPGPDLIRDMVLEGADPERRGRLEVHTMRCKGLLGETGVWPRCVVTRAGVRACGRVHACMCVGTRTDGR